jgi:RNA polymerase sigma factor (sigma-70 family)
MDRPPNQGELSDAELISSVRGGDVSAYGDLFARHRDAATRLARQLVSVPDADDLVSEAFAKVLNVLLAGGGPDVAFRAYLLTAVRRLHVDKIRLTNRAMPTDDLSQYDEGVPFKDTVIAGFEGGVAARAYASLPERWQLVLWHLEVEGQKPADVAPLLGMTPNSVSALAYRAREGLRQAYLQMHSADIGDSECRWTHEKLGAYVRKGLSRRDAAKVEEHLRTCRKCTALLVELTEVNSSMAGVIGPIVLGSASVAYLGSIKGAGVLGGFAGTSVSGLVVGLSGAMNRAKEVLVAQGRLAIGIGGAVALAGLATFVVLIATSGSNQTPTVANPPNTITTPITTPSSGPTTPSGTPTGPTSKPPHNPPSSSSGGGNGVISSPGGSKPSGKPQHTKSPSPPPVIITPTPAPPTTTPIPSSADYSARIAFQPALGLLGAPNAGTLGNLTASAAGLRKGTTGWLKVEVFGGTLTQLGTGCQPTTPNGAIPTSTSPSPLATSAPTTSATSPTSNMLLCRIRPNSPPLSFKVNGVPVTASATVFGPDDIADPNSDNNRDSVLLGLL